MIMLLKPLILVMSFFLFSSECLAKCVSVGVLGEFSPQSVNSQIIFGDQIKAGIASAVKQINKGQSVCLEPQYLDISYSNANIKDVLVSAFDSGIKLYIGLGRSDKAFQAKEILKERGGLLITPTATSDELIGRDEKIILLSPRNSLIASSLSQYLINHGVNKISIIYAKDEKYSVNITSLFKKDFESRGGVIGKSIAISTYSNSLDSTALSEIATISDEFVFLPLYQLTVAKIISFFKANHFEKKYVGTDSWGTYDEVIGLLSAGDYNAIVPVIYDPKSKSTSNIQFTEYYREHFNSQPTDMAARSYDGMRLLAAMLGRCKIEKLLSVPGECLKQVLPFEMVTGEVSDALYLSLNQKLEIKKIGQDSENENH